MITTMFLILGCPYVLSLSFWFLQVNPEIALSGASAKVKLPKPVFSPLENALKRRVT